MAFMNKAEALLTSGGNRFLIEEALNRAMALDQSLANELKTKSGNFYKDLSSKLKYSFYKTIDQNEEYDEDNDNEGENYVLEMNNNRIIGDIDFIAFTLEDKGYNYDVILSILEKLKKAKSKKLKLEIK
ncbi:hypothetical protein BFL38_13430 [Brachyspira hampsonii]|uniref:Uncharacterized protein n=1 Tax=Brachyspira hampsonii TaxID=1287055 RepID=A0A1E5NGK1_9SPIR|nr:hypothetical protein [Brachyspira hampsonii]OEJ15299.1 hypothetical protein BFL38_13430 [Brachyspira hampsonii]